MRTAIRAQANRVAQLKADLAVKRARIADRIRTVLTPHQITKLKALAGEVDSRVDSIIDRICSKVQNCKGRDIALRCPGRRGTPSLRVLEAGRRNRSILTVSS